MKTSASSGLEALALRLTERLAAAAAAGGGKNLVFSPLSIYAALALAAAGARGRTLDELLAVLSGSSQALADRSPEGGPWVMFACGLWHDATRELRPAYRAVAADSYAAETRAVDFHNAPEEAAAEINSWVAAATNNLIGSIIESVPAQTDLVLANAVYFNGKWGDPFDKTDTKHDKFHRLDGSAVDVPFMRSWKSQCIACHRGFKVLKLYYEPGPSPSPSRYSMCVFLPHARDGLQGLIRKISRTPGFLRAHLPTAFVRVRELRLPKFKLAFSGDVTGALRDMGLRAPFQPGMADLSGMLKQAAAGSSGRALALEQIFHKAVIEVGEEGTEAAAVTGGMPEEAAGRPRRLPPPVDFVADHPFAFFVVEEVSGAIVFAGHVLDPANPITS